MNTHAQTFESPIPATRDSRRLSRGVAGVLLIVLGGLSACHRTRDTTLVETPTEFVLSQELYNEYDEDWYGWTTTLDQARVTFRVRHFAEGWARVRIYDHDGFEIFDETYHDYYYYDDGHYCDCDDEFTEIDVSEVGVPGDWLIRLEVHDFTGSLYLTVD
ncbi:MAG: hypothetical protein KDC38_19235 [Planctomycetes bacterium]|nr:hypothetical protein [Planctomycetota bacterium]